MKTQEHFTAGRLDDAIDAQVELVKEVPNDLDRRMLLCELLCFAGDLERADQHLDTMSKQDASTAPGNSLLRQLIRAETHRRQFFTEGRVPEFMHDPSEEVQNRLRASIAMREGNRDETAECLAKANDGAGVPLTVNGTTVDNFRDLDDLIGSMFEVFTPTGKYFWIPMNEVVSIEFRQPQRPIDLLWRRAGMSVRNGPDGEVYLPVVYHGSHEADDEALRLGRSTNWGDNAGVVCGLGQRMYLLGEAAAGIIELTAIKNAVQPVK